MTLSDIAEKVGVTPQLVSFYFNNPGTTRVAKETRDKIDSAARKLKYQPNRIARALVTGKTNTIGLIMGGFTQRKRGCFVHALMNTAKKHKYNLLITITNYNQNEEQDALEYMLAQQVDGILYHLYLDSKSKIYKRLKKEKYPILLHVPQAGDNFNTIGHAPDAFKKAIQIAAADGHKNICYVNDVKDFNSDYISEYCKEFNMQLSFASAESAEHINAEIKKNSSTIAIFVNNDVVKKYCLEFPKSDVNIVIPYTLPYEYISDSRITGVIYHNFLERAAREIELMLEIINNPKKKTACELLPSHFLAFDQWQELYKAQCKDPQYKLFLP